MKTYIFIDASNLFYGGKKSLGWSIDHEKLRVYLKEKYNALEVYYFGGVEIYKFHFDYIKNETVPVKELEKYLFDLIKEKGDTMTEAEIILLNRHYRRVRFYVKLEKLGYQLVLKPVKTFDDPEGNPVRKANCDVDMTLMLATKKNDFDRAVVLSGDGDFLPVLKYLKVIGKEVLVLARGPRTAKEIKQFAGSKFMDFEYLRERLKRTDINGREI